MLKEMAGRDGLYAQFLRTPKVLDVVRNDEAASRSNRAFEHHVVARIAQERAPEIVDVLQAAQRSQMNYSRQAFQTMA